LPVQTCKRPRLTLPDSVGGAASLLLI